jgi:hypothetical protein
LLHPVALARIACHYTSLLRQQLTVGKLTCVSLFYLQQLRLHLSTVAPRVTRLLLYSME